MGREILETKQKQQEREKGWVFSPPIRRKLDKIYAEVYRDIIERLKNDQFKEFHWGEHWLKIVFDEYYSSNYCSELESMDFWVASGEDFLHIDRNMYLPEYMEEEIKKEVWKVLCDVKNAQAIGMSYKDYQKNKSSEKTRAELEKQKEIQEAKKVLEKYKVEPTNEE